MADKTKDKSIKLGDKVTKSRYEGIKVIVKRTHNSRGQRMENSQNSEHRERSSEG
jgi:hypothetical protein